MGVGRGGEGNWVSKSWRDLKGIGRKGQNVSNNFFNCKNFRWFPEVDRNNSISAKTFISTKTPLVRYNNTKHSNK